MVLNASQFRFGIPQRALILAALVLVALTFHNTFPYLWDIWQREEYSHGFLIPVVSAFLIWQRREALQTQPWPGSWTGAAVVLLGLVVNAVGALASITTVDTYALVIVLCGLALALLGRQAFRLVMAPLLLLFLMNPIPAFLFNNLSAELQLLSSQLGVVVIRLFGVSVYLEGNVIDLGSYKLQVAEACSGLRYLLPLLTLGVLVAYLVRCRLWIRLVLVLSTMPITIVMNSLRIGLIGVLVDRYGEAQAQGFLHFFEGWVVFIGCLLLLVAELYLLLRVTGDRRGLRDVLVIDWGASGSRTAERLPRNLPWPVVATLVLLAVAVVPSIALPSRREVPPARQALTTFPLYFDGWEGRAGRIEDVYLDVLKLTDYVMADFHRSNEPAAVNLYVAYYASQRTGQAVHSPASCLPGGGWLMQDLRRHAVPGLEVRGRPLEVNRVVIQQGAQRELVYYWFQERGRDITDEFTAKWYLLTDAISRNRTDGALVRLITPLGANERPEEADARLVRFLQPAAHLLPAYVPD